MRSTRKSKKSVGIFRFHAHVEFLDDVQYTGITKEHVLELIPGHYNHSFIVLVDQMAISQSHHPLLIVDLYETSGREFRAIPSRIQSIENNLSIANMDFEEFARAVDEDGYSVVSPEPSRENRQFAAFEVYCYKFKP